MWAGGRTIGRSFQVPDDLGAVGGASIGAAEQLHLDTLGGKLEVRKDVQPWWMPLIALHRDHFYRTCIAKEWDQQQASHPPEVFVVILAVQQPLSVYFLKGCLRPPDFPATEELEAGSLDLMSVWAHYSCDLHFYDARDIGVGEDDLMFVLPALWHVPGGVATSARLFVQRSVRGIE